MAIDNNLNREETNEKESEKYYFKLWKSYEDVAMHFNDLIIRLRTQSIGGLAALATILGIFLHSQDDNQSFKCGLAIIATICLILLWVAIWTLDMCYYNRLLEGAVNAILEIEKNKATFFKMKEIKLSTNIDAAFLKHFKHENTWYKRWFNSRNRFYMMVLCALGVILIVSILTYCRS